MKKTVLFWLTAAAVVIYSAGLLQFAENKNTAEGSPTAEHTISSVKYTVKEYNGRIAVFVGDEAIPVRYLQIKPETLREYDREQFKKGVMLDSLREVLMLEEDFSS